MNTIRNFSLRVRSFIGGAIVLTIGIVTAIAVDTVPNPVNSTPYTLAAPATIAASTTDSSTLLTIDTRRTQKLPLQLSFKTLSATTNTSGLTFSLYRSIDGTTYETTAWASYTLAANSTTTVVGFTNVDCAGVPYLKIATFVNGNSAQLLTNIVLKAASKAELVVNTPSR